MRDRPQAPIFGPENARLDAPDPPKVRVWRSLAKAVSWRTLGTIDTLVLSFVLITYLGPLFGFEQTEGEALEKASLIAITEVATKMVFYFLHERLWASLQWGVSRAEGKRSESLTRTSAKTTTWRLIASLDTFVLALLYTGSLATAVSIGSLEIFTKLLLYFVHERIWAKLPFGIDRSATDA